VAPSPSAPTVDMDKSHHEDSLIKAIDSYFVKAFGEGDEGDVDSDYTLTSFTGVDTGGTSNAGAPVFGNSGIGPGSGISDIGSGTDAATGGTAPTFNENQGTWDEGGTDPGAWGVRSIQGTTTAPTAGIGTGSGVSDLGAGTGPMDVVQTVTPGAVEQPDQGVLVEDRFGVATDDQIGADLITGPSGVVTDDQIAVITPKGPTGTTGTTTTGGSIVGAGDGQGGMSNTGTQTITTGTYTGTHDVTLPVDTGPTVAEFNAPDTETSEAASAACAD